MLSPHLSDHLLLSRPLCLTTWMMGPKLLQAKMLASFSQMRESITCLIVRFFALKWFHSMSGELGSYTIVVGNEGDRNDLALWFKGGSLVSIDLFYLNNQLICCRLNVLPVFVLIRSQSYTLLGQSASAGAITRTLLESYMLVLQVNRRDLLLSMSSMEHITRGEDYHLVFPM